MQRYPTLAHLLGRHFDENWGARGQSADDVLAQLVRGAAPPDLGAALRELDMLIEANLCEPQLSDVVQYEIGCFYIPQGDDLDMSRWLAHVRALIAQSGRKSALG